MAYYLVRAKVITSRREALWQSLESAQIRKMQPFGSSLDDALRHARLQPDGTAVWEEEDYCRPPLAAERAAVLDHHFIDLTVEPVQEGDGWRRIEGLPRLWTVLPAQASHPTSVKRDGPRRRVTR